MKDMYFPFTSFTEGYSEEYISVGFLSSHAKEIFYILGATSGSGISGNRAECRVKFGKRYCPNLCHST